MLGGVQLQIWSSIEINYSYFSYSIAQSTPNEDGSLTVDAPVDFKRDNIFPPYMYWIPTYFLIGRKKYCNFTENFEKQNKTLHINRVE